MAMMRQIYDLQELDWEIDRYQMELASVEASLRDDTALVRARAETVQREEALRQIKGQHAARTLEVQELQEKVRMLEKRLYGGSVRLPRELESLQAEMEYAKGHAGEGEEALLTLMIGLDESEEGTTRAKTDLEQMERAWSETQVSLSKEQALLTEQLQGHKAKRPQLTLDIAPSIVTQYERVRKAHQGYAVAKVERGMCVGCRLTLPTKELQRVRTAQEPVTCSSCGRILYMMN